MTEYEEKMLDESKKQTAILYSIKASTIVLMMAAAIALGLLLAS